jgi:hypothetical protein
VIACVPSTHGPKAKPHHYHLCDPAMAATAAFSRRRGHGCFLQLLAATAVLAAFGAALAVESSGYDRVLLNVDFLFPSSSCAAPQG